MEKRQEEESLEGMPAFVKSWRQVYWALFIFLVVLIALFSWFTEAWS